MTSKQKSAFQQIESIDLLLNDVAFVELSERYSRSMVRDYLRLVLSDLRGKILADSDDTFDFPARSEIAEQVLGRIKFLTESRIKPVINVTGTITHTNLGRSLLPKSASEKLLMAAENPVALEYELSSGKRSHRDFITEPILQFLTGCEASTIVNNNAAAVLLMLNTFARGKEVVISRGELVEIGGSFRIPEVMEASGAILREVGTTNRTRIEDYENAISDRTAILLRVHPSNYKIVGFSSTPELRELVELSRRYKIPLVEDLGSGSMTDLSTYNLPLEPIISERIKTGINLVSFSGDKLLGGSQAGIIVGKLELIEKLRKNPLMRAMRVGKLTIAAIEATLMEYLDERNLPEKLPMLRALTRPIEEVRKVAEKIATSIEEIAGEIFEVQVKKTMAQIGSGTLPIETLPSISVLLSSRKISVEKIAKNFRLGVMPIIGRIEADRFFMDMRQVFDREEKAIIEAILSNF